ncbi:metallophosphoesterase [Anaerosalibacter massiliensis]|uniref:metallophosphoesterase n=1 Tax=Anaerosalibacter massiliensis TaxID=1347392 RepID=UPI0005B2A6E2|nr:metallophosphoesterase [Anaerosalibacter massiliensis]
MRIFVVSDTHGRIEDFVQFAKKLEKPDLIIHLGDYADDGFEIERAMNVDTVVIKGNCDFLVEKRINNEEILTLNGKKVLITHGHRYNVKMDILDLFYRAKEEGADLVLFGHTHNPLIVEEEGILFMNPGSPSLPRGLVGKSFGLVNIEEDIKTKIIEIK